MPCVFSTIGYITEANTTNSYNNPNYTTVTSGIIACNRPEKNDPVFINFISFNQSINSNHVYFLNGKFVWNKKKSNGSSQELQVKTAISLFLFLFVSILN
jgi:hypothetical protein